MRKQRKCKKLMGIQDSRHSEQSKYTVFDEESDFRVKSKQLLRPEAKKIGKTYLRKFMFYAHITVVVAFLVVNLFGFLAITFYHTLRFRQKIDT